MIDLSASQKQQLAMYRDHLARLERGEAWLGNHPGRLTVEEKAKEIGRLKALIAKVEAGEAQGGPFVVAVESTAGTLRTPNL